MSKRTLILGTALLVLAMLLAGCKAAVPGEHFDVGQDLSKAQRIVVSDAAGHERAVLTEQADLDVFVDAVNVDGWRFRELPEGLTEAGSFTLWQTETITALIGKGEVKENEICTFRIYKDGDYLTIETALVDIPFSIPKETADYLRGLAA